MRTITVPRMQYPAYLAFAPHRFTASLKGSVALSNSPALKLAQADAVLSVTPGSRTIMLSIPDDAANTADYASLFGGVWHVFHGFESFGYSNSATRLYHGTQVNDPPAVKGVGAISLTVKGAVDTNGWFSIKSASGNLLRAKDGAQFNGTLTGKPMK